MYDEASFSGLRMLIRGVVNMLKKMTFLLLSILVVAQLLVPSVVFANESQYKVLDEVVSPDAEGDDFETEDVLDEIDINGYEEQTLDVEIKNSETVLITVDGFESWTEQQMGQWQELINENWVKQDHVSSLLFFAEGGVDITEFEMELLQLSSELWVLLDVVGSLGLSFTDAVALLNDNTIALENLTARLEALGVIVLPAFSNWTSDQIEDWEVLQFENWGNMVRIKGLEMNIIEAGYFTWIEFDEKFSHFLDEFMILEVESAQIRNDAYRSRLSFEEAVLDLELNTLAFADLFERFYLAIWDAIHESQDDQDSLMPPAEDEVDDAIGDEERSYLPQTGTTVARTALIGIVLIAVGGILLLLKKKMSNKDK